MLLRKQIRISSAIAALGLVLLLAGKPALAANWTWDASGNGSGYDNSGSWTLTGSNWWTGALPDSNWNSANTAVFGAAAGSNPYTVTLSQSTTAAGLTFANQAYTLSGGTLTFPTAATIAANAPATINSTIVNTLGTTTITATGGLTLGGVINCGTQTLNFATASNTSGTLQVVSGANISAASVNLFQNSVSTGILNYVQTGGLVSATGNSTIGSSTAGGDSGCINIMTVSGGTFSTGQLQLYKWAGIPILNISGSGVVSAGALYTGWADSTPSSNINIGDGLTFNGGTSIQNGGSSGVFTINSFSIDTRSRGTNTINFNGGTLKAGGPTSTLQTAGTVVPWLPAGYFTAVVEDAGGIIDNGGFQIAIGQVFAHGGVASTDGGLVFQGNGITTLTGASTYNGGTVVKNGTLLLNGGSLVTTGTVSVASGATFGGNGSADSVTVAAGGILQGGFSGAGGMTLASLTYSGSGTISGALGATAPVAVSGGVTTAGANTITANVSGPIPADATYHFLTYVGGSDPFSAFKFPSPSRAFTLVDNSGASAVDITVNTSVFPIWSGAASGDWSYNNLLPTGNWVLSSGTSVATNFMYGDKVVFNDTAGAAHTSVAINNGNVSPSFVVFNNNGLNYTISGSNSIAGGSLIENGTGTVTISNANAMNGGTLNAGTLLAGNNNAISSAAASALTITGGTLGAVGGSLITLPNNISATGNFGLSGGANGLTLAGAVTLSGSETISVSGAAAVTMNGGVTGAGAALVKNGGGMLNLVGAGATYSGSSTVNGGTLGLQDTTAFASGTTVNAGDFLVLNRSVSGFASRNRVTNVISGAGTINVNNTVPGITGGWVTFNGPSSGLSNFTGTINVNSGVLAMDNTTGIFSGNPTLNVYSGGLFAIRAQNVSVDALNGNGDVINSNTTNGAGGKTLTVGANNGSGTFTGVIHGNIASGGTDGALEQGVTNLTKAGTGTEALFGANTYSGSTTLSGGILALDNASAIGPSGKVVFGGGTMQYTALNAVDYSGRFATTASQPFRVDTNGQNVTWATGLSSVAGTLFKTGSGSLVLGAASNYSGATTVNAGNLYFNGASNATPTVAVNSGAVLGGKGTLAGAVTVSAGGGIEAGNGGTGTLTLGSLTYNGNGSLNLGALANYTGIAGVNVTGNNDLTTAGPITVGINVLQSTGTYRLISYAGAIQGSGSSVFQLPAVLPGRGTVAHLSDPGHEVDLVVTALDYLKWTGASNPANGWNTTTPNWQLNFAGTPTTYIDNPGDTVVFDDGGGTNNVVAINAAPVHPYSVTFSNNSINYTLQGQYGIAGATGLTKSGTGILTVSNTNSYTGGTAISSGILQIGVDSIGAAGSLTAGPLGTSTVALNGGVLSSANTSPRILNNALNITANSTLGDATNNGALSLGGAITLTGSRVLTVNSPVTVTGAIGQDSAGRTLTKSGPASLTLTGAGSSYSGGTVVSGGIMQLGDGTTNGVPGSAPVTINSAGTLAIDANAGGQTFSNTVRGNGTLLTTGGTLNLNVASSGFSGNTTVRAGTLLLTSAGGAGTGPIVLGDASSGTSNVTLYFNAGNSQTLSNPIIVSASGSGTASILGFSDLGVIGGALTLNRPTTLGGITGDRYGYSGPIGGNVGTLTIDSDRITFDQPQASASTFTGNVVINATRTLQMNTIYGLPSTASVTANGNFYLNSPTASTVAIDALNGNGVARVHPSVGQPISLQIGSNNGSGTFSGTLTNGNSVAAALSLIKSGTGVEVLNGTSTYAGKTSVNGGTLQLGSATALPANTPFSIGAAGSAGMLDMDGNGFSISSLAIGSGAVAANQMITNSAAGNATLSINIANTGSTAFNGLITQGSAGGTTALTLANSGTLVLGGNNGYTGPTTLSGGTLYINGQQTGPASVATGTRFGGNGRIGAITVASGGAIEGGYAGGGALTANSLTFSDPFNSSGDIYIGGSHAGGSIAAYTGTNAGVVLSGALSVNNSSTGIITLHLGGTVVDAGTYHLIQHVGPIVGINPSTYPTFSDTFFLSSSDMPTLTPRQTAQLQDDSGAAGHIGYVDWVVSGGRPVWSGVNSNGGTANNNWMPSNPSTLNWKLSNNGSPTYYMDNTDTVLFDDTAGAAHTTINVSNGNVTPADVAFANNSLTYTLVGSNAITGPTKLTMSGSGVLVVTNTNDYSGGTFIDNGTLRIGSGTAQIGTGNVSFGANAGSTARLQLFGNSLTLPGLSTDANYPGAPVVENGAAGTSTLTIANTTNYSGVAFAGIMQDGAGGGQLALNVNGFYNVTLLGANTYSGSTTITGGNIVAGADNVLPHGAGKGPVVFNGGALDVNGHTVTINQASFPNASSYVTNNATSTIGTLIVGDANTSSTLDVTLADGGGTLALTKIGNGTVTVTGANSFSGGSTVSAGTLQVGSASALGTGGLTMNGGVLDLNNNLVSVPSLTGNGGAITDNTPGPGTNTFTVNATVGGYIGTAFGGVIRDGANGTTVAFTKAGVAGLTLAGTAANTYSGGTTYVAGALTLGNPDGVYAIPGNISFSPTAAWGETYDLQQGIYLGANQQIAPTSVLNFTDQQFMSVGLFLSGYTQTIGGLSYTHAGATPFAFVRNAPQAFWSLSAPGTLVINTSAGSSYTFQGAVADLDGGSQSGAQLNIVKSGPGMQELAGSSITYTGTTNVTGGTLMLTDATAFASNVTLSGGTLVLNSTAGTLEPFTSSITGTGSVVASGIGGVMLTAINNYTGGTTVTNGTLDIAGGGVSSGPTNVPSGVLQVDSVLTTSLLNVTGTGATQGVGQLAGSGQITLTSSSLKYNSSMSSTYAGVLTSTTTAAGLDVSSGTLTLTGLSAYLGNTTVEGGSTLIAMSASAIPDGSNLVVGNPAAFPAAIVPDSATGLQIETGAAAVAAVPEPGTLGLLAAGGAAAVLALRRRKRIVLAARR